jgi:hypothetical protein
MNILDKVSYGYFPDFKEAPVVLFTGNGTALKRLAQFFENLLVQSPHVSVMLDCQPLFEPKHRTRLTVTLTDAPFGMKRVNRASGEPHFEWGISKNLASRFAELTRGVAESDGPSHQYLDSGRADEVTVTVSKDEYDESLLDDPNSK